MSTAIELSMMACLADAGVAVGLVVRYAAMTPATWGHAIDVPESVVYPPLMAHDRTNVPGAKTSTQVP
ncbi:hypothetical protein DIPPA_29141 [Diplonema papillatum]|nr:hypothetical protein DIPPA_16328 [Diplonema papillatum]KAJ9461959.1 hypothetical protein DIPPA_29141 [Diplonema papillatum]